MAQFKLRVSIDQGRAGVRLESLANIAGETQKFLRMVGEDIGLGAFKAGWVASDFKNGSLSFDVESTGEADEGQVDDYRRALDTISSYEPSSANGVGVPGVRNETVVQFAKIAVANEPGESIKLGIYEGEEEQASVEWKPLTKQQAVGIIEHFESHVEYHGMIHGIIHSLYKETQPPYFDVRDLSSGQLVKCYFAQRLYHTVWQLLKKKDAIVFISGVARARRADRKIEYIDVERMDEAPNLSDREFSDFFGCDPNFTGKLTTSAFIERSRKDG